MSSAYGVLASPATVSESSSVYFCISPSAFFQQIAKTSAAMVTAAMDDSLLAAVREEGAVQAAGASGVEAAAVKEELAGEAVEAGACRAEAGADGPDAGSKRPSEQGADAPSKRAKHEKKEPKKEEPVPGHRKFLLSGITGIKQEVLQSQLDRSGIHYNKLWKARNKDTGEIWLKDNDVFLKGCKCVLNGTKVHGRVMKMAPAPVEGEEAASRPVDAEEGKRTLSHQVTPLCDLNYEEQVEFKRQLLVGSLEKVTKKLLTDASTGSGVEWVRELAKGPVCPLEKMHRSPDLNGYRNKNEFTIGYGEDGKPMVGFRFGRFADGNTNVGCADGVLHTPEEALGVARCMTEFLRDHQTLACWVPQDHSGVWRMIMVRHNRVGDVMVLVQYSSKNCTTDELDAAIAKLKSFLFEKVKAGAMKMTSLFLQVHNEVGNRANDDSTVVLASGEPTFSESILGLNFRISPSAFFQVNTRAAELLYGIVRDWASADKDELILDVCCGTGTIGLCMSGGAKKVVGLELCADAVKDAKLNAVANKVLNCEFEVGRAEDTIPRVCAHHLASVTLPPAKNEKKKTDGEEAQEVDTIKETKTDAAHFGSCVAVLDPPREGVHWKVIKALRGAKEIERIVYVSCNHTAWVDQARALCCPAGVDSGRTPGEPFRPVRANGVDLFPHTSHVELVVLFERGACLERTLAAAQAANGAADEGV